MLRAARSLVVVALAFAPVAFAGDLAPPGPPGPTMRTLDEIEARIPIGPLTTPGDATNVARIVAPGSYYLTGDLIGEAGKQGILISSGNVTLDLNGFTLQGGPGTFEGLVIVVQSSMSDITVRNGTIRDWGGGGASVLGAFQEVNLRVERVTATGNAGHGLSVGDSAVVESCIAADNTLRGINAGNAAIIRDSLARDNGGTGIRSSGSALIEGCTALRNGQGGIFVLAESVVANSVASNNLGDGIEVSESVVRSCAANGSSASGVKARLGSSVVTCTANGNTGDGFWLEDGSSLTDSLARSNQGNGAYALVRATVRNSTFESNAIAGIRAVGYAHIRDNTCMLNLHGIRATEQASRIEGNMTMSNTSYGIRVEGDSNFIIRNYALGNGVNYSVVAGNMFGSVLGDVASMNAAPNNSFNVGN